MNEMHMSFHHCTNPGRPNPCQITPAFVLIKTSVCRQSLLFHPLGNRRPLLSTFMHLVYSALVGCRAAAAIAAQHTAAAAKLVHF
jgi:hypothetical protein